MNPKDVEEFAKKVGAKFKLTSAASNAGIKELFTELGKEFIKIYNNSDIKFKKVGSYKLKKESPKENNKKKKGGCC